MECKDIFGIYDWYGRSGAWVQTLRVGLSASEILISKFIGFQRTSSHGETSNIHAGKLCYDYIFSYSVSSIWTDICNDSFPSTIQYWRLIETHKPSCNQAYSSKTKLSSPLLVRPPFELGSWKAERRKTLPFSSKLRLLAQIARLWPLWGCDFAVDFFYHISFLAVNDLKVNYLPKFDFYTLSHYRHSKS